MYNTDLPTRAELPSTGKLLRSTLLAAVIAIALLVTVVLPAEYAIDPTGAGRLLGLTEMGEIKAQLAEDKIVKQIGKYRNKKSRTDFDRFKAWAEKKGL